MATSRAQTRSNYDRLSRWYDLLASRSEQSCRDLGLRKLNVQPGEQVLEIGAGTGQAVQELSRAAGPEGGAWAIDLSFGMCQVAQRRNAAAKPAVRPAAVICADAMALPFRSAAFDAVFMSFTLELLTPAGMTAMLGECARVLCPAGRLAVVALADRGRPGAMQRLYAWAHREFPSWVDCRPIPVTEILADHAFRICDITATGLWGLHVDVALADRVR